MGSVDKDIWRLAWPCIVGNISIPLLSLTDVAISGHLRGAVSIGAISIGSTLFNTLYWVMGFLRMGSSGLSAQAVGRGDNPGNANILARSLFLALSASLAFIIAAPLILQAAFLFMKPEAQVADSTALYFRVLIYGAPAVLAQYSITGWMIGNQDTKTPVIVAIIQNIGNIILSLLFVFLLDMDVKGLALGSLIAQYSGLLLAFHLMRKRYSSYLRLLSIKNIWSDSGLRQFFSVNRDIFLRTLCMVLVTLFFTTASSWQGTELLAANTLLMQLFLLFSYFMDALAFAAEALCGKAAGKSSIQEFASYLGRLIFNAWGIISLFTLLYLSFGENLLGLLTSQEDVIENLKPYIIWGILIPLSGGLAFLWDGVYIGLARSGMMLLSVAVSSAVFLACFLSLRGTLGNHALWMAFILYLSFRSIIQYLLLGKAKRSSFKT